MAEQNKNDDLGKLVKNTKTEEYKEIKMGENMIFFQRQKELLQAIVALCYRKLSFLKDLHSEYGPYFLC